MVPVRSGRRQITFQPSRDTVELVLIQGKVTYVASRESFEGPCVLPNKEERLTLHYDDKPPKILEIQGNDGHENRLSTQEEDISGRYFLKY